MSYNIDSIEILSSDGFCIPRPKYGAIRTHLAGEYPEACIFEPDFIARCCEDFRGMLFPKRFGWCGEGSGRTFDSLRDVVLPAFCGAADLLLTWEGGDSHTGLRLLNGVVTEHEIVFALGKEKQK